jgi:hypothetical protein
MILPWISHRWLASIQCAVVAVSVVRPLSQTNDTLSSASRYSNGSNQSFSPYSGYRCEGDWLRSLVSDRKSVAGEMVCHPENGVAVGAEPEVILTGLTRNAGGDPLASVLEAFAGGPVRAVVIERYGLDLDLVLNVFQRAGPGPLSRRRVAAPWASRDQPHQVPGTVTQH